MRLTLTVRCADAEHDVLIRAPAATTLGAVTPALAEICPATAPGVWHGSQRLPADAELGTAGLRSGAVISAGRVGERDLAAAAVLRLQVAGGPGAGQVFALPRGDSIIGRAPDADIALPDVQVSRRHAAVSVTGVGLRIRDLESTNGVLVDGRPATGAGVVLTAGAHVELGASTVCLAVADDPAAVVRADGIGTILVNRSPRRPVPAAGEEIAGLDPVPRERSARISLLMAVVPALGGAGLALASHQLIFLALALLSPVLLLATGLGQRWRDRSQRRRRGAQSRVDHEAAAADRAARLTAEMQQRRYAHPDPAAVRRTAEIPGHRLWERRPDDPDFLDVRLGLADQPSWLTERGGAGAASAAVIASVPVPINLRSGPLGICGPRETTLGITRSLIGQLAVLHAPADVRLVVLAADDRSAAWHWARWLPHLNGAVAVTATAQQALIVGLLAAAELASSRAAPNVPWTVILVDSPAVLERVPGLATLLLRGATARITAICLAEQRQSLPAPCSAIASVTGELGARLQVHLADGRQLPDCLADQVAPAWAETVARALAPLREATADGLATVPASCNLLDLIGPLTPATLTQRWATATGTVATLGRTSAGPLELDLVRDGPHLLIAGTTGAGKSELLRTLVVSLALNNSPRDVSFILIDYKGGAAFADCVRLPHIAGLVTDLDPPLTQRALRSLHSELRRREQLFAAAGVAELASYRNHALHRTTPLGRLVIIVDEFAALADELPELLTGLVSIARRGRSLGVHLVLATQRPAGAVSAEIQANMSARIALRVTDAGESVAVIGDAVAAALVDASPGRGYLRTGSGLREFQTALAAPPAPVADGISVELLDCWNRPLGTAAETTTDSTRLTSLVDLIRASVDATGLHRGADPWLAPLPEILPARLLEQAGPATSCPIGLIDRPDEQRQDVLTVDLAAGGSLLFAGPARSGRSTALRTIALLGAQQLRPDQLQVYVIDCAGAALADLDTLPHCGASLTRTDPDLISRLLTRLAGEVAQRAHQSATTERPALLLVIDGWENFSTACDEYEPGVLVDRLAGLLRDAGSAALTVAIAGGRAALTNRVTATIARTFVLGPSGPADQPHIGGGGAGSRAGAMRGGDWPAGRGQASDGSQVQLAFCGADPGTVDAIAAASSTAGRGPIRVRSLPSLVRHTDLASRAPMAQRMVLGVGGDEAAVIAVDLFADDARWLIAGPRRSGRTTLLALLLTQLVGAGCATVVAATARSELADLARQLGIGVVAPTDEVLPDRARAHGDRLVVLIDDLEQFADAPATSGLLTLARQAGDGGRATHGAVAVVATGLVDELAATYRGLAVEIRRGLTGLLLQPSPVDGDLLGVRLPGSRGARRGPPGRGVLVSRQPQLRAAAAGRAAIPIQVATIDPQPMCG